MKLKAMIFLMAVMVLAACSKDLLDVTFDAEYKTDLDVAVGNSKAENGTFNVVDTIDLANDAEVKKYLDRIKKFDLTSIAGKFTNVSESFTLITGNLKLEGGGHLAEWNFNNLTITEAYALALEAYNGQYEALNLMLMQKPKIVITFSGETDKKNITFVNEVLMKTKVTANPLD